MIFSSEYFSYANREFSGARISIDIVSNQKNPLLFIVFTFFLFGK